MATDLPAVASSFFRVCFVINPLELKQPRANGLNPHCEMTSVLQYCCGGLSYTHFPNGLC